MGILTLNVGTLVHCHILCALYIHQAHEASFASILTKESMPFYNVLHVLYLPENWKFSGRL